MNTFKRYNKAIWFAIGWFILFVLMQTGYMVFALIFKIITDPTYLAEVQSLLNNANSTNADTMKAYTEIIGSITSYIELALIVGMSGLYVIDRQFHQSRFGIHKIKIVDVPQFVTIGIALNIASTLFINSFSTEFIKESGYEESTSMVVQGGFLGVLIGVGICAPLCEEITFRYFIFHNLNRGNTVLAVIGSSAIFGLAHGNLLQGIYAFAFGLIFSLLDIKYNSILPGIIMHISINLLSVLLMSVDTMLIQIVWMCVALLISLVFTVISLVYKKTRK